MALPWGIFLKASSEIREGEGFPGDHAILAWLHAHASPALDTLALALTRLGGPLPMSGLAALIFWYLWRHPPRRRAWFFLVALGGAMLLNVTAKTILGRVRPAFWHSLAPESTAQLSQRPRNGLAGAGADVAAAAPRAGAGWPGPGACCSCWG
ncbi:MAG: hypothetical protein WKG07_07270 [Hymenobacter sp.]